MNDDLTFSKREVKVVNQMKGNTSHGFRKQFLTDEAIKIPIYGTSTRERMTALLFKNWVFPHKVFKGVQTF